MGRSVMVRVFLLAVIVGVLPACASSMMMRTEEVVKPGPDYAVVNFLRPSSYGGAIKFGVWDKENFIGILTPKNYIQYKAAPGEHIFMARAENWAVIKAKVEAGKTYYILGAPRMGVWKARVALEVVRPGDKRIDKWMDSCTPITVDPAQREAYVRDRIDNVKQAVQNVQNGSAPFDVMNPSDGQ